jgi:hypothetical protein
MTIRTIYGLGKGAAALNFTHKDLRNFTTNHTNRHEQNRVSFIFRPFSCLHAFVPFKLYGLRTIPKWLNSKITVRSINLIVCLLINSCYARRIIRTTLTITKSYEKVPNALEICAFVRVFRGVRG